MIPILDLMTGRFGEGVPTSRRALSSLRGLFADAEGMTAEEGTKTAYELYGCLGPDSDDPGELLYATTILYPGQVNGEYFMTRGHFHKNPARGEYCMTLAGQGGIVLMDRERNGRVEWMTPGSVHNLDGRWAHRVVNTGAEPLVFLVVWMSDCGHDYETIARDGFSLRVLQVNGKPEAVPVPIGE